MTYWIVVGSEENMRIAEARGFDIFGFKSTRRSEVSSMRPGGQTDLLPDEDHEVRGHRGGDLGLLRGPRQGLQEQIEACPERSRREAGRGLSVAGEGEAADRAPAGAVRGREGDRPDAGVHQEVAGGALAPGLPGQPARDPGGGLQPHRGDDAGGRGGESVGHSARGYWPGADSACPRNG